MFIATTMSGRAATNTHDTIVPMEVLDCSWANPEYVRGLREKRQQRTTPRYGAIYDLVLDTLYRYDPWGVGWKTDVPFGAEEYELEADKITPRLPEAQSASDVQRIAYEVMGDYYGETIGGEKRYAEIAQEIWRGCREVP